ncbi:hypothetical protein HD554DRAFT_2039807 [Boletus coccyginus]|nr:hypothetical protein HD554DRAFT_2039807 [Boletus coccyginus]
MFSIGLLFQVPPAVFDAVIVQLVWFSVRAGGGCTVRAVGGETMCIGLAGPIVRLGIPVRGRGSFLGVDCARGVWPEKALIKDWVDPCTSREWVAESARCPPPLLAVRTYLRQDEGEKFSVDQSAFWGCYVMIYITIRIPLIECGPSIEVVMHGPGLKPSSPEARPGIGQAWYRPGQAGPAMRV